MMLCTALTNNEFALSRGMQMCAKPYVAIIMESIKKTVGDWAQ